MKRIFIAVDISAEARAKAAAYVENLRRQYRHLRVGWEKSEKFHLTLKFLGETDEARLKKLQLAAAVAAKKTAPFKLLICGTGVFPDPRRARVLWLGVTGAADVFKELSANLEASCKAEGFAPEKKVFNPHLTIARLREPDAARELAAAHLRENFLSDEFAVTELVIYESRLLPHGSQYAVVSKHELGSAG